MFHKPYSRVTYFGQWADETADSFGRRDAFAVLIEAVRRCVDDDARTKDTEAALAYLEAQATRKGPFKAFRRALELEHPTERQEAACTALEGIKRVLSA